MEWRICKAGAEFIEATFNLGNFRKVKSSALEHYSTVPAASLLANSLWNRRDCWENWKKRDTMYYLAGKWLKKSSAMMILNIKVWCQACGAKLASLAFEWLILERKTLCHEMNKDQTSHSFVCHFFSWVWHPSIKIKEGERDPKKVTLMCIAEWMEVKYILRHLPSFFMHWNSNTISE